MARAAAYVRRTLDRRRRGAEEFLWIIEGLRPAVGVIILHLVVVPRHQRRGFGVQSLKVRIGRYWA